jgi:hypothetical protein
MGRLSTGRARGPWPEGRPGPALEVRGSGSEIGGPAPKTKGQGPLELALALRVGPGPGPDRPYFFFEENARENESE